MTSFSRWHTHYNARWRRYVKAARVVQWCYAGGHPALTLEVERWFRGCHLSRGLFADIRDVVDLDANGLTWLDLGEALTLPSLGEVYRLVILRRADDLSEASWARLARWVSAEGVLERGVYLLAIGEELWPESNIDDPRYSTFVGNTRGGYIRCPALSLEQQAKYVAARFDTPTEDPAVALLVRRCGGDASRLMSECSKLSYLGQALSQAAVHAYVAESPGDQFVEALLRGRKDQALARAPFVPSVRYVVSTLDWNLYALFLLRQARVRLGRVLFGNKRLVITTTGLPPYTVELLLPRLRSYTVGDLKQRYAMLVEVLERADHDQPELALAPLVARW